MKLIKQKEKFMNMKNIHRFYFFICLFPTWIFFKDITFYEKLSYFTPFLFFYLVLFYFYKKNFFNKIKVINTSIITVFGLDQNLLLNLNFVKPNFETLNKIFHNIYFADIFLILLLFFFSILLILFQKENAVKIIMSFILVIFLFNLYDTIMNEKKIINFDNSNLISKNYSKKKTLFIILDEMSGMNSISNKFDNGNQFINEMINFSKINDFHLYTNAFSISDNSGTTISYLLNFEDKLDNGKLRRKFITKSIQYFNEYDFKQNKLFDEFNSISVIQNVHLNFCTHPKVKTCYQFNPYLTNDLYLNGFKDNELTKFFSLWKIEGSSSAKIFWRIFRQFGLTDSILEPEAHKVFLPSLFFEIKKNLSSNKYDLVFAHILAPHIPYGFEKNCNYNGQISLFNTYMTNEEKFIQHNIERICMMKLLGTFFENIKKNKDYENTNIVITSDHGSRISSDKYSTIFLTKIGKNDYLKNNKKISIQSLSKKIFSNEKLNEN